jgi:uncharacterized membrane protein YgcG
MGIIENIKSFFTGKSVTVPQPAANKPVELLHEPQKNPEETLINEYVSTYNRIWSRPSPPSRHLFDVRSTALTEQYRRPAPPAGQGPNMSSAVLGAGLGYMAGSMMSDSHSSDSYSSSDSDSSFGGGDFGGGGSDSSWDSGSSDSGGGSD